MKKPAAAILIVFLSLGALVPAYAKPVKKINAAKEDRKMQKKQAKAMKKYLKAQKKADQKMIKKDRKNTHLPSHY
jgi:sortase (surface protein transpeptidase)